MNVPDLKLHVAVGAAAVALAYAGLAGAAIRTGSISQLLSDGELFMDVINTTAGVSATFDLFQPVIVLNDSGASISSDPTMADFTATEMSKLGIRLEWNLAGTAAWTSFVGAAGAELGASKFDIKALGPNDAFGGGIGYFTTSSSDSATVASQQFAQLGNFVQVNDFVTPTNGQATHSSTENGANFATAANTSLYHETAVGDSWKNFFAGNSTGAIGSNLPFYQLSGDFFANPAEATLGTFGGVWNLSANGVLSYTTAPIPEPGTWAMLAAGLLAVGAIARRRITA